MCVVHRFSITRSVELVFINRHTFREDTRGLAVRAVFGWPAYPWSAHTRRGYVFDAGGADRGVHQGGVSDSQARVGGAGGPRRDRDSSLGVAEPPRGDRADRGASQRDDAGRRCRTNGRRTRRGASHRTGVTPRMVPGAYSPVGSSGRPQKLHTRRACHTARGWKGHVHTHQGWG